MAEVRKRRSALKGINWRLIQGTNRDTRLWTICIFHIVEVYKSCICQLPYWSLQFVGLPSAPLLSLLQTNHLHRAPVLLWSARASIASVVVRLVLPYLSWNQAKPYTGVDRQKCVQLITSSKSLPRRPKLRTHWKRWDPGSQWWVRVSHYCLDARCFDRSILDLVIYVVYPHKDGNREQISFPDCTGVPAPYRKFPVLADGCLLGAVGKVSPVYPSIPHLRPQFPSSSAPPPVPPS